MEENEPSSSGWLKLDDDNRSAVNSLILNYYKKFGKKRDLEQYFSLTTAQRELQDSSFWNAMKALTDSSDSSGKQFESATELCRISIKCSPADASSSQEEVSGKSKLESTESPPIITEENPGPSGGSHHSDDESGKSDGNRSFKSLDATLDTSMHKATSPTSSITFQRKLEWDSLADVGYANESDKKTSSSLSTLERLALKPHYSNNEDDNDLGSPTAHSTMAEVQEPKTKPKRKGFLKKITEVQNKDIDTVEVNLPSTSGTQPQSINVNLTKHISFNVDRDGVTVEKNAKTVTVDPSMVSVQTEITPIVHHSKEIQTTLQKNIYSSESSLKKSRAKKPKPHHAPIYVSLNTLSRRLRRRRAKLNRGKKKSLMRKNTSVHDKSGEQVSEAESFEYMPGHIYNQNQLNKDERRSRHSVGNKSSLESSGAITTESSKQSSASLTKDLDQSILMIQEILKQNMQDSSLKKELIKKVVSKLVSAKYKDDVSLISPSKRRSKQPREYSKYSTTTSTSDANVSHHKVERPKKSILRLEKFDAGPIASTSQSAPNLPAVTNNENPVMSILPEESIPKLPLSSQTESDVSSKGNNYGEFSDNAFAPPKTSSEELYRKYLEATRREEIYKKYLQEKHKLFKQKLVCSDSALKPKFNVLSKTRLKEIMKDLSNFDGGSGDACRMEGNARSDGSSVDHRLHRNHSVFTLSAGSEGACPCSHSFPPPERKKEEIPERAGCSNTKCCSKCCQLHRGKLPVTDSCVQVNIHTLDSNDSVRLKIPSPHYKPSQIEEDTNGDIKYVCISKNKNSDAPDNVLIYKCSKPTEEQIAFLETEKCIASKVESFIHKPSTSKDSRTNTPRGGGSCAQNSKFSQTEMPQNLCPHQSINKTLIVQTAQGSPRYRPYKKTDSATSKNIVHQTTRWTQSEISINPQLDGPLISDIVIVTEDQCAKIVSQHFREVPETVSNKDQACDIDICMSKIPSAKSVKSIEKAKASPRSTPCSARSRHSSNSSGERKCINITEVDTGSNSPKMKFVVSVDSNTQMENVKCLVEEGVATDVILLNDNQTSLREECSKSVQSNVVCGNSDSRLKREGSSCCGRTENVGSEPTESSHEIQEENRCHVTNSKQTCVEAEDLSDRGTSQEERCIELNSRLSSRRSTQDKRSICEITTETQSIGQSCCGTIESNTYPKTEKKIFLRKNTADAFLPRGPFVNTADIASGSVACSSGNTCKIHGSQGSSGNSGSCPGSARNTCHIHGTIGSTSNNVNKPGSARNACLIHGSQESPQNSRNSKSNESSGNACSIHCSQESAQTSRNSKNTSSNSKSHSSNKSIDFVDIPKAKRPRSPAQGSVCGPESRRSSKKSTDSDIQKQITDSSKDTALELIRDITKRYSKKDLSKNKRYRCFKEIMNVLNYLLETDESTDGNVMEDTGQSESDNQLQSGGLCKPCNEVQTVAVSTITTPRCMVDKAVQQCVGNSPKRHTESSELPASSDMHGTSSDSATCKVLHKIKSECEKYHQRRCKTVHVATSKLNCECSSSTSVVCHDCNKVHYCPCRMVYRSCNRTHKVKKSCVAYNLIIQTSDSVMSEENTARINQRKLQDVVVKVPSKKCLPLMDDVPSKKCSENLDNIPKAPSKKYSMTQDNVPKKTCSRATYCNRKLSPSPCPSRRSVRSKSAPREPCHVYTGEDLKSSKTVKEYLECNRPDFIKNSSTRQACLKNISESRHEEPCCSPKACPQCPTPCAPSGLKMFVVNNPSYPGGQCTMYYSGTPPCNKTAYVVCFMESKKREPSKSPTCLQFHNSCMQDYQNEVTRIARERAAKRQLLSMQLPKGDTLRVLREIDLNLLARELGFEMRKMKPAPKFISEKEMKQHSERIYRTLPEVRKKKEDVKKENIKKTNLLMAYMFKKNLQKKTLRGTVNLSNYSPVVKI